MFVRNSVFESIGHASVPAVANISKMRNATMMTKSILALRGGDAAGERFLGELMNGAQHTIMAVQIAALIFAIYKIIMFERMLKKKVEEEIHRIVAVEHFLEDKKKKFEERLHEQEAELKKQVDNLKKLEETVVTKLHESLNELVCDVYANLKKIIDHLDVPFNPKKAKQIINQKIKNILKLKGHD